MLAPPCSMMILQPAANGPHKGDFGAAFEQEYRREFGFTLQGRAKLIDDIRVRAVGLGAEMHQFQIPPATGPAEPVGYSDCFFEVPA